MIDRKVLVRRHNVLQRRIDPRSPLSVGNGEFAFTMDVTGLQTLPGAYPAPGRYGEQPGSLLGTQAQWAWHSTPVDPEPTLVSARRRYDSPHGPVSYVDLSGKTSSTHRDQASDEENWLRNNPHRLMLGEIGLSPRSVGLDEIRAADVSDLHQELDLWTGTAVSRFRIGGARFMVTTAVHPDLDVVGFRVRSEGGFPAAITLRFPYGSEAWGNAADWDAPDRHESLAERTETGWRIERTLDDSRYAVALEGVGLRLDRLGPHSFDLAAEDALLEVSVGFSPGPSGSLPSFDAVAAASAEAWAGYWSRGGMVQLAESADPRALELERRVVLSQYQTRVHCAGTLPPQETGLMVNSWRGRFHLEMHWWHAAHFPIWNRPEHLERSLGWYYSVLDRARTTAAEQGFAGARWPKQVGPDGRESPSDIGPFLIWQQPHPIYLAELIHRSSPDPEVLERYAPLVFATAEFMAAYAHRSRAGFELGPPLIPAQESYGSIRGDVRNPTFELAYWAWALRVAGQWRQRLGLAPVGAWQQVAENLVTPTVRDGRYSAISVPPFTVRTDHPSMLAALGVVPETELIDRTVMNSTLDDVLADWDWGSTWGWDYPVLAMCATRLGRPEDAVAALLMDSGKNTYLSNGHNFQTDALPIYLPGNGGLLTAVALMAAGWDGSPDCPGFPPDGGWKVEVEDIRRLP